MIISNATGILEHVCAQDGYSYYDSNGQLVSADQQKAQRRANNDARVNFAIQDYRNELATARGDETKHTQFVADFDKMLQNTDTDANTRNVQQMARRNADTLRQLSVQRRNDNLEEFPEEAFDDKSGNSAAYQKVYNSVYGALPGSSDATKRKARSIAREGLTADQRAANMDNLRRLERFRSLNQRRLADPKLAANAAKYNANIASVNARIESQNLRGFGARKWRTRDYTDKQTARLQKLQDMYKTRLYDPRFQSPQARAQAERNIARVERFKAAASKRTYDANGWAN